MPTEELGLSAHRKYDIETWMPAKAFYGEVRVFCSIHETNENAFILFRSAVLPTVPIFNHVGFISNTLTIKEKNDSFIRYILRHI